MSPRRVGKRSVVGINREAQVLNLSTEEYFGKWKEAIKNSELSDAVKQSVLSNVDFNDFYGMGILVITIPPQKELSYFADHPYLREGDSTKRAQTPKEVALLAQRF